MDEHAVAMAVAGTSLASLLLVQFARSRHRQRRDERAMAESVARGANLPSSLHPVIDTEICIGSLACLRACPEGDILGIVDGAARLVHGTNCVGHGRCAAACPVHAIKLVFGTATRGVDLPELSGRFESSRLGVHVVGELAGMGLIRNAIEQGAQCAGYLAEELEAYRGVDGAVSDVVVIGAGPAGVSCALSARARNLSVRLLDRGRLGSAIANFPRQGLISAGTIELPGAGKLKQQAIGKEALLAYFERALSAVGQRVEGGVNVTGLTGSDGAFTVETEAGAIRASKVVLATGRRGRPRRLSVPGEELPKVTYSLVDADRYAGKRVMVVGGGDAAVEAACALAERGGVEVTLVHRGSDLVRCTLANRDRAFDLADRRKLTLSLACEVLRIEERSVELRAGPEQSGVPNDYVIACLGGELPLQFLAAMGVQVRRLYGEEGGPRRPDQAGAAASGTAQRPEGRRRRLALVLAGAIGLGLLAGLAWAGRAYYPLGVSQRHDSPLHLALKPASRLGLTIGITATAVMLTNFLYAMRKRWRALSGLGQLSGWLDVHVFVGIMSPLVISFHAAFQSNNLLASGTYSALGIVVTTGLIGRYFYGLVPGSTGTAVELADLLGQHERLKARVRPLVAEAADPARLERLVEAASAVPPPTPLPVQLGRSMLGAVAFRLRLAGSLRLLPAAERASFRDGLLRLHRLRTQASVFGGIKRLMRAWRGLHAALAILLVGALMAHIGVAVYLGYGLR